MSNTETADCEYDKSNPEIIRGPAVPPIAQEPPPSYSFAVAGTSRRDDPDRIFYYRAPPPPYDDEECDREQDLYFVEYACRRHYPGASYFGFHPVFVNCPYCHRSGITEMRPKVCKQTHILAMGLCLCGCWPCCLLPYCISSSKKCEHYCQNCNVLVGVYVPW